MKELQDAVYNRIVELSEQGDQLAEKMKLDEAILKYQQALELLPEPIYLWEASTWLFAAIGDAYYFSEQYNGGLNAFLEAQKCPDALDNPFICMRIGECFYEIGNFEKAESYLLGVYMLDGKEVFLEEEPKYWNFLEKRIAKQPE